MSTGSNSHDAAMEENASYLGVVDSRSMSLSEEFEAAVARVNGLAAAPPNQVLLDLYGLYKQATSGDVSGARPGMMDFKGRAKYDSWAVRKGMSRDDAMRAYVARANAL